MSKRRSQPEEGGDSWLNTYADMVTLLLTFFALMLSMSNTDQEKFNAFIKSFSSLPPEVVEEIIQNPSPTDGQSEEIVADAMSDLYAKLSSYVQENNLESSVSLSKVDDVIYIRFNSAVFFEPDKYVLRTGAHQTLAYIGAGLKQYENDIKIINVCGHTADPPNSNDFDTIAWMLSSERAAVVARFLQIDQKIEPDKLITIGYAGNFPVADNSTEEGMKQNRRVELVIIGKNSDIDFNAYDALSNLYDHKDYPTSGGAEDVLVPSYSESSTQ